MIGKKLDEFKIVKIIGEGGVGKVFLAIQESLEREVAIKIINPELDYANSKIVKRFMHEAKSMASITHPNIVNIHKVGVADGVNYIVMEYIDGTQLDTFFSDRPFAKLKEKMVWETFHAIVNGLLIALQHGIIHRDIKPGNILIDSNYVPKITDFGIAKNIEQDMGLTFEGVIMGSPSYISPEQAAGGDMLYHTDMYSLGASLYHILTGKLLFPGDILVDVLYKQISSSPLSPQNHISELSNASTFILAKLLHKRPEQRYLSYSDLLLDISLLLENKPLVYANSHDALAVFDYEGNPQKYSNRSNFFTNWLSRSYLTITKQVKTDMLWVSNRQPVLNETLQENYNIHYINSLAELKFAIKQTHYLIVFDMSYMNIVILKYLNTLYNACPTAQILFLTTIKPPPRLEALFVKAETPSEISEQIKSKKSFLTVGELSFLHIAMLIETFHWSLVMKLNGDKATNSGLLTFFHGKYTQEREQSKCKTSKTIYNWDMGSQTLPNNWTLESAELKITTPRAEEQNVIVEESPATKIKPLLLAKQSFTSKKLKPVSAATQVENPPKEHEGNAPQQPVVLGVNKTKITNNGRQPSGQVINPKDLQLSTKLTPLEPPTPPPRVVPDATVHKLMSSEAPQTIDDNQQGKLSSMISELDQAWDNLLVKRKKGNTVTKSPIVSDKQVKPEVPKSDNYAQFTYLMDKAIEHFLHKSYDQAYEYLLKAKRINSNAPILKMNLKRLEKMGYGKKQEK